VLTAGLILAHISMIEGKRITWVPSYGSEMRGGTASCRLRIGDSEILNPFFTTMGALVAMNHDAVTRFEHSVVKNGLVISNSTMVKDHAFRGDIRVVEVPATDIAASLKNPRGANITMLGATIAATRLFPVETFADGIDAYFAKKGRNNPLNRECFLRGAAAVAEV
jgi:2-oxoglutarate ferredoxin oxidoreductase subunit gamma